MFYAIEFENAKRGSCGGGRIKGGKESRAPSRKGRSDLSMVSYIARLTTTPTTYNGVYNRA